MFLHQECPHLTQQSFTMHGIPNTLVRDNATCFTSENSFAKNGNSFAKEAMSITLPLVHITQLQNFTQLCPVLNSDWLIILVVNLLMRSALKCVTTKMRTA